MQPMWLICESKNVLATAILPGSDNFTLEQNFTILSIFSITLSKFDKSFSRLLSMTIPNRVNSLAIVNFPWSIPTIVAFPTGTKSVFSKLHFRPDILANSSRMSPIYLIL